jgi:type I restriction enzyme S subunit
MNADRLLKHFDRISEAPDAIPRLRRFILDLAVQGKLVGQDPNDEPASELLKRIEFEKAHALKKTKTLPSVSPDEVIFDIPANWKWVRIRQITSDRGQTIPKQDFTYIDVTAINKESGCIGSPAVLSADDAPSRARKLVQKGDVIYSCVRPYLLNIAIIDTDINPAPIASTAFAVLNGFGLTLSKYLWAVLRSPFIVSNVEEVMRGQAYPAINDADFSLLPIPLPPLAEQHRIVAKVDELMALCDRLQAARTERERNRDRLVAASLHRLNPPADEADANTQEAQREHARFLFNHLPRLTTRPEHIKQLRQTILNLAVRGQLVPQDPNDEPAMELLNQIHTDREGSLKKQRSSDYINIDMIPYRLPSTWTWTTLGSICHFENGDRSKNYPSGPDIKNIGIPFINTKNIVDCKVCLENIDFISEEKFNSLRSGKLQDQDILIVLRGSVGKFGLFEASKSYATGFINAQLVILRNYKTDLVAYGMTYLKSQIFQQLAFDQSSGSAQPQLSAGNLGKVFFPLPPLAEQHRIVAKVDELMALCDQLEAQLANTAADSRRLLEAVLHEALLPAG